MSKKKVKDAVINEAALDALIAEHGHPPEAILGERGLLAQLTKALGERVLGAELTHHLKTGRSPLEDEGRAPESLPQAAANCRQLPPTAATLSARRPCWATRARWRLRGRATGRAASSRCWRPSGRSGCRASMRRSSRCLRAA